MSDLEIWLTIGLLAVSTIITRSGLWLVGEHLFIPRRVQEILRYAPVCALAAIVAPDILGTGSHVDLTWHNFKMLSGLASIAFYLWRRDMLQTIVFGMFTFTVLRLALG